MTARKVTCKAMRFRGIKKAVYASCQTLGLEYIEVFHDKGYIYEDLVFKIQGEKKQVDRFEIKDMR